MAAMRLSDRYRGHLRTTIDLMDETIREFLILQL